MKLFPIGSFISMPFYSPGDAGGSGGADGDTGSGTPAAGGTGTNVAGGGSDTSTADEPLDIDENRLIRVKGSDKPIKFGEYGRTFQSQFTKASQEAARLKKELETERQTRQRYEQQQQQSQRNGPGQQGGNDVYAQLEQLPYLSGKDAVQVVQSITDQIGQRDQVLIATLKQMQQMKTVLDTLNGNYTSQSFDTKISKFVAEGQIPKELTNRVKELYMAYEGDDLDEQFPSILRDWYEDLNKVIDSTRQAKLRAARNGPFIPGRGGNTGPSKPVQLKGNESPKALADMMWDQFHESET